jgi:hypothetical protein
VRTRVLAAGLVALGGDLSFLVPTTNVLERTRHFWVFHSFSAEALLYNPWTLGAPLLFSALLVAARALEGSRGALAAAGLLIGSLWPTKLFAFACLTAALGLVAALTRKAAPIGLALCSLACAAPWLALALHTGWSEAPFVVSPFYPVYSLLAASPKLENVASRLGLIGEETRGSVPGLVILSLLCLAGALGVRLLGLRTLVQRARRGTPAVHQVVAAAVAVGALLAFAVVGSPTRLEGTQFLMVALYLLWPYAAESLANLAGGPPLGRLLSVVLVAAAVVGPVGYLARKRLPERLTAADSWDHRRFVLGAPTLEACGWLRESSTRGARLALPLRGDPENVGGLLPLHVAAASARRVAAGPTDVHVSPSLGDERRALAERLFETRSAEELGGVLDALGADWIWEPPDRPLAVRPRSLELRFASARVRLYRRQSAITAGGDPVPPR